ncbi:MAG: glycosyltransferase family 4 protein [Bacteroidota bacterium]
MKILVISNHPRSLYRFRGKLINTMTESGHEVYALTPKGVSNEHISKIRETGAEVNEYFLNRTGLSPIQDLKTLISLILKMRKLRPDIVLSYTIKPVIYGSIAAFCTRVPKIFSIINGTGFSFSEAGKSKKFLHFLIKSLFRFALSKNSFIFFQNNEDRNLFIKNKIVNHELSGVTNGSGIDLNEFEFHPYNTMDVLKILFIGRFFKEKGIYHFVEAAKEIKKKYGRKVEFQLIGEIGNDKNSIKTHELKEWEKEGWINNLGFVDDVKTTIIDSHIVVLPSYYREGVPRSLLEALSIGRAIITTNSIGCKETVIDGKNGILIKPDDLQSLIEAIEKLINNPIQLQKMGARSRQLAKSKFDVETINQYMLEKIYMF